MTDTQLPSSTNRIFGLDVLRAAAIVLVVLAHGTGFCRVLLPPPLNPDVLAYPFGVLGVELFFCLS